jgi:hypothetical protein
MNDARSLYAPLFRWAKRRRIVARSPMADFELPTSRHVAREHVPPEVDQLCRYLEAALEVVPDVAPVLTLGAVTGMRRGELVGMRRSRLIPTAGKLVVDAAYASGGRVKTTKTRKEREVAIDKATMAMLLRHCERMDERAELCGVTVPTDGFVFSLEPDCSRPMEADYVTKQVARLKDHLGIADKRPATIALEDEALRLYRSAAALRTAGRSGPTPAAGCPTRRSAGAWAAASAGPSSRWRLPSGGRPPPETGAPRCSTGRSSPCGSSRPASCSTPGSTSPPWRNVRVTARRCSSSTMPRPARPPTAGWPSTWVKSSTGAAPVLGRPARHAEKNGPSHRFRSANGPTIAWRRRCGRNA